MADIRVEKETSTPIWPWLLGLLFLVLAGLFLFGVFDDDDDIADVDDIEVIEENVKTPVATPVYNDDLEVSKAVAAFAAFIETPNAEMNLEHDYTRKGLRMLSASLESMTDRYDIENVQLQQAKALMMRKVAILDDNAASTKHADHIKEAFMSATAVMEQIQQKRLPTMGDEVNAVIAEAKDFSANELTLHQKDKVKSFFDNAAKTISMMAVTLQKGERVG